MVIIKIIGFIILANRTMGSKFVETWKVDNVFILWQLTTLGYYPELKHVDDFNIVGFERRSHTHWLCKVVRRRRLWIQNLRWKYCFYFLFKLNKCSKILSVKYTNLKYWVRSAKFCTEGWFTNASLQNIKIK